MKRIIAYIYNYRNEGEDLRKQCNAGFCKVEFATEKCSVAVCLKDGCGVEGTAHLYMLKREKNAYCKVALDRCHTMCAGVLNTKLCMVESDGICVECGGRIYISLWNECPETVKLVDTPQNNHNKKCQNIKATEQIGRQIKRDILPGNNINDNSCEFDRIYNRLCKKRMILNGVEYPAVRLSPQEMILLPRSCWRLANNILLMESYYRYRHILFLKYEGRYVIAVPWAKQDDRAKGYGFEQCVSGYEFGRAREEKNYWLMNLQQGL